MALTIALVAALTLSIGILVINNKIPAEHRKMVDQLGMILSIILLVGILFLDPIVGPKVAAFLYH